MVILFNVLTHNKIRFLRKSVKKLNNLLPDISSIIILPTTLVPVKYVASEICKCHLNIRKHRPWAHILGFIELSYFWIRTVLADILGWTYLYLYLHLNRCICICIWIINLSKIFVFVFEKSKFLYLYLYLIKRIWPQPWHVHVHVHVYVYIIYIYIYNLYSIFKFTTPV